MGRPVVSILIPCLNARPFLNERVDSILGQTFSDWEAIVLDSYSDDGSWEFFQSVGAIDQRFRLYQVPREGLYVALNRGIALATGEFIHVATCDDTMMPDCLATLLDAFEICPRAGIAACDVQLINANGEPLLGRNMIDFLPLESINDMLALDVVRSYPRQQRINYRPPPHDSLLHFSAKSVYFSLTQLLIRTTIARSIDSFETKVGSIADLGWLVRLTNITGTVHVPRKLTMWRFHGDQLSLHQQSAHLVFLNKMLQRAIPQIYLRHYPLLTRNDCAVLLLPIKRFLARTAARRLRCWLETFYRTFRMLIQRPRATFAAVVAVRFRPGNMRRTLIPMFMRRLALTPKELDEHIRLELANAGYAKTGPKPSE
jgi:glycosyltransferase involved in cell wall biosynthesis